MPLCWLIWPQYLTHILVLTCILHISLAHKREAGFYTTRFGRSDPMMARANLEELRTRFLPETEDVMESQTEMEVWPGVEVAPDWEETHGTIQDTLTCVWSVRNKNFLCREASAPWKKAAQIQDIDI